MDAIDKSKKPHKRDAQQLFSCNPDPPTHGTCKLGYSGTLPVEILVTFTPPGGTGTTYTITTSPLTITVPDDAESMNVVDLSGASDDLNRAVSDG